ncbi:GGDEF domain-containing protein [Frateuria edaphi]|uniref:GGDEF domain-containing protein n=1 Tax=Frateuria edaphi TaxID=2898793 RepID=UPI001E59CE4A|nr:GGDEF domain-containing protein [Frateuria edaphi]UGB44496.1 GGDEF domain-containing protein [Frateuria edaphi]
MNLSVVPDFLAIGGLVLVFAGLLRRTRQTRPRLWLVGWAMILVHIVAQFVERNLAPGPAADAALAVSLSMLLLASVAFVWAGSDARLAWWRDLGVTLLAATPDVAFFVLAAYGSEVRFPYLLCTVLGLASTAWVFRRDRRKPSWCVPVVVGIYALQGMFAWHGAIDRALDWMLFWHYLAVAFCFYRGAVGPSVGVVFTTVSFVAWAAVFPVAAALAPWLAGWGIENEAWNLPKFLVATGMIFTLLEEQIGHAEHASQHDALTGLPNRRVFANRLEQALRRARESGGRTAMLVIDLNDFKRINDTLGHAAGDALLHFVAQRLQQGIRAGDTLARLGGDEFAAILPEVADRAAAQVRAERLARAFDASTEFQGQQLSIGASIGLALYPDDGQDETRLYAAADRAMYASKLAERGGQGDVDPEPA